MIIAMKELVERREEREAEKKKKKKKKKKKFRTADIAQEHRRTE